MLCEQYKDFLCLFLAEFTNNPSVSLFTIGTMQTCGKKRRLPQTGRRGDEAVEEDQIEELRRLRELLNQKTRAKNRAVRKKQAVLNLAPGKEVKNPVVILYGQKGKAIFLIIQDVTRSLTHGTVAFASQWVHRI